MIINETDVSGAFALAGGGRPSSLADALRARVDAILKGPWRFRDLDQMTALYEQLAALVADVDRHTAVTRDLLASLNSLQYDVATRAEATRLLVKQLGDQSPSGWEEVNLSRLLREGSPEV